MRKIILLSLIFLSVSTFSQNANNFGIKFSGFVRTDIYHDSRQTISLRDGYFLLYPDNKLTDPSGKDLNDYSSTAILCITTRLKGNITGPDALGAKTSGYFEGEFFGMSEADVNGFRLRHAYLKLNWPHTELMAGQYWNPYFLPEAYPLTANFNTGTPFTPFSRHPQVKLTQTLGQFRLVIAALSQRDYNSMGPNPADPSKTISSPAFLRNAGIPDMYLMAQFRPDSTEHIFALGGDIKTLMPETFTLGKGGTKYYTSEKITSMSAYASIKLKFKPVTLNFYGIYAQNGTDMTMIGGMGVKAITDSITGHRTWTNVESMAISTDIHTNHKTWNVGVFAGYEENLGSSHRIVNNQIYGRNPNIAYLYRVSPRVSYAEGKLEITFELDNTTAAYGIAGNHGRVTQAKEVTNWRSYLLLNYNF